ITLKRDEVLRFTNLPTGTTYTIQEVYANYKQANPSRDTDASPSAKESNLAEQGYTVSTIKCKDSTQEDNAATVLTGNEAAAGVVSGTIEKRDARYYNQFTNRLESVADAEIKLTKHLDNYTWSGERYY
ncbi:hypothetical protein RCJ22_36330, partial [Vibrio sp. FNV 38]|nr:hypothetical protein [Vibrio sp. FNV 38]